MEVLKLRADSQKLEILEAADIVSGTVGIYEVEFEFSEEWTDYTKTAVFVHGSEYPWEVVLTGSSCVIPWEAIEKPGILRVGLYGVSGANVFPTIWTPFIKIHEGTQEGSIGKTPTPTVYAQIVEGYNAMVSGLAETETDLAIAQKKLHNISEILKGHEYSIVNGESPAYIQPVETGAMRYALLNKLGGRTVVRNQLLQNGNFASTAEWTTGPSSSSIFTVAENTGTVEAVSTSGLLLRQEVPIIQGHVYYARLFAKAEAAGEANFRATLNFLSVSSDIIIPNFIATSNFAMYDGRKEAEVEERGIRFAGTSSTVSIGDKVYVKNFILVDLTKMFGLGSEPSIEECRTIFSADYYATDTGTIVSADVDKVVSSTGEEHEIPTAIRELTGYGWSAGNVCNYIDFEQKKFIRKVSWRNVGSGSWSKSGDVFIQNLKSAMAYGEAGKISNLVCPKYTVRNTVSISSNLTSDMSIVVCNNTDRNYTLICKDTSCATADEFKAANANVPLYYETLETIERDVSEYLDDDLYIDTEPNGTVTFHQSDTTLPVFNEVAYMVRNADAL